MKCKNISTRAILLFLAKNPGKWHNWYFGNDLDVRHAILDGFNLPDNLVLAKMRILLKHGLIEGCPCGRRGDFEITEKGLKELRGDK